MILPQFVKQAFASGMRQRFVTISDGYSNNPIRRLTIRPLFLFVILLILGIFIAAMGYILAKNNTLIKGAYVAQVWLDGTLGHYNPFPAPVVKQLNSTTVEDILSRCLSNQRTLKDAVKGLTHRLQEAETSYQFAHGRIEVLQQGSNQKREEIEELTARIQMFEELFQSHKVKGTRVLKAVFKHKKNKQIQYEITLAKGGNYPLVSRGRLQFIGFTEQGKKVKLRLLDESFYQTYKIETHAFLRGTLHWTDDVVLSKVQVIHQRKDKKNYVRIGKTETEITGDNHGIR